MSSTEPPPSDDELFAALQRAAARFDPPPEALTAANRRLLSWRDPDAELAELVADSRQLADSVRGPSAEVVLRFTAGPVSVVVQVEARPDGGHRLVGQLEADRPGTLLVRQLAGSRPVVCDQWGRFAVAELAVGPLSFRWTPSRPGTRPVDTAWTLL